MRRPAKTLGILVVGLCSVACDTPERIELESTAILTDAAPLIERSPMDTLGLRDSSAPRHFAYDLPDSWRVLPATQYRRVNLRFGPKDKDGQCYLVVLPGGGGTLADNVNRWRNQMGQDPLDAQALGRLPRKRIAGLGVQATVVDLRGAYTGMGGKTAPKQRFIGLIWQQGGSGHYMICVGPEALVDSSYAEIERLFGSLRPGSADREPTEKGEDAPTTRERPEEALRKILDYDAPKTWRDGPRKAMRILNFYVGADDKSSCYVAQAGGTVLQNVNRWRNQLGAKPISQAEVDALETVRVLGVDAVVVEVSGDFSGGMGARPIRDAMLLGSIAEVQGVTLFIKMLGPKATIAGERENFLAFCRSMRGKKPAGAPASQPTKGKPATDTTDTKKSDDQKSKGDGK